MYSIRLSFISLKWRFKSHVFFLVYMVQRLICESLFMTLIVGKALPVTVDLLIYNYIVRKFIHIVMYDIIIRFFYF